MTRVVFVNPHTLPLDLLEASMANVNVGIQNLAQEGIRVPTGIKYLSAYLKRHVYAVGMELLDYRTQYPVDLVYKANLISDFVSNENLCTARRNDGVRLFEAIAKKYVFHIIAHDYLRRCYREQGLHDETERIIELTLKATATDGRAREMTQEFGDLLSPELAVRLHLN